MPLFARELAKGTICKMTSVDINSADASRFRSSSVIGRYCRRCRLLYNQSEAYKASMQNIVDSQPMKLQRLQKTLHASQVDVCDWGSTRGTCNAHTLYMQAPSTYRTSFSIVDFFTRMFLISSFLVSLSYFFLQARVVDTPYDSQPYFILFIQTFN